MTVHRRIIGPFVGGPVDRRFTVADRSDVTDPLVVTYNGEPPLTHGSQVTAENTGYTAWFDETLGRNLELGDLSVIAGDHYQSDFYTSGTPGNPTIVYRKHFTGACLVNLDYITYRGCLFDQPVTELVAGGHHKGVVLDYRTVDPAPGVTYAYGMGDQSFSINRSYIRGGSDSLRCNGGQTPQYITESYLLVQMDNAADHNDNVQNNGGSGNVYIVRSRLDLNPEGGLIVEEGTIGGPNACFLSADMASGSKFHAEVRDCLLDGSTGAFTLRFYDGALTRNISYVATGNHFVRTGGSTSQPVHRGSSNITPLNQIVWSGNVWADDPTGDEIPLV